MERSLMAILSLHSSSRTSITAMRCWPACHTRHSHHCSGSSTPLYTLSTVFDRKITWRRPPWLFIGSRLKRGYNISSPPSTGEKSSNLHHILATAYHCMPSINGSTIGHRWWAVHTTIEAKIRRNGFSHIGTKSSELCTPRRHVRLEACTSSFKWKLKTFLFERYFC